MRDDFDSVVADRFKVLDDVPVPDTWSRVQLRLLDPAPVRFDDDEATMIDLEAPSATDERRTGPSRAVVACLLAAAAVLVVAAVVLVRRDIHKPAVVTTTTPPDTTIAEVAATTIANGWVAFAAGVDAERRSADADIYLVREGSPAHRIAGSDSDAIDQVCPTFSPDSTRLAYGEATGTDDGGPTTAGYQDAGLVIADLTADGVVSATTTIALDDMDRPPCAIWSADGRWMAFGAGTFNRSVHPSVASEIWVVDTETDDIRRLPGISGVTDIEWAPEAAELYIANQRRISIYSVETDLIRVLADSTWGVEYLAVSPNGHTLAVQGRRASEAAIIPRRSPTSSDLRLMDVDGTGDTKRLVDRGVISQDFDEMHGIGPVWSPDGAHIAFQRLCDFTPDNRACSEQHEVVVVTVNENGPVDPRGLPPLLDMAQVVILPPATTDPDGTRWLWYPYNVIWSPDSTTLLYGAWGDAGTTDENEVISLLAVRIDGETPPVVLYDALDLSVYDGNPRVSFQSWSRQQQG